MKTAIFLGAGASKAEGAPLQGELFQEYFNYVILKPFTENSLEYKIRRSMITFFKNIFHLEITSDNVEKIKYPSFEEVLGVLEQAIKRNESFIGYVNHSINDVNKESLILIRQYVIMAMAQIIHEKLSWYEGWHHKLVKNISDNEKIKDMLFLSANYDILIDNALSKLYETHNKVTVDYGLKLTNYDNFDDWKRPTSKSVKLIKLHGSLNWLKCPCCNRITLTPQEKAVITRLMYGIGDTYLNKCGECNTQFVPFIIPPSYFKELDSHLAMRLWENAETEMRKVDHIIFCGYSFPDADFHIKYLIKRIQTNRKTRLKFTVINHFPGKKDDDVHAEEDRFVRFLGQNVNYTDKSFQDFAQNPFEFVKR